MFASGQQIAEQYRHRDPKWLAKYLHAKHSWCCPSNDVEPISGEIFGDEKGYLLQGRDGANNSYSPDAIRPVGGAIPVLRYLNSRIDIFAEKPDTPTKNNSSDVSGALIEDELLELFHRR